MDIYIVEIGFDYEGSTAVRAFTNEKDANAFALEIERRQELKWKDRDYCEGDYAFVSCIPLDDSSRYEEE